MPGKIIRVLPNKITRDVWENVKTGATENGTIDLSPKYLTGLLHDLMSDKAQCFFIYGDDEDIRAVALTRLRYDPFRDEKYLRLEAFYAADTKIEWEKGFKFVQDYAGSEGCAFITVETLNKRAMEVAARLGFRETKRRYDYRI